MIHVAIVRHNAKTRRFDYTFLKFHRRSNAVTRAHHEAKTAHQVLVGTRRLGSDIEFIPQTKCGASIPTFHEYPVGFFNG